MSIIGDYSEEFLFPKGVNEEKLRETMGLIMQDKLDREAGKVVPDTIGADYFFLEGFITDQMCWDYPYIERDFLIHCYRQLPEFDKVAWYSQNEARYKTPEQALKGRVMGLAYNGAKLGDEYCVALIKYLHKLYHKKEYNQLKRFRNISAEEVLSMSREGERTSFTAIGRILGMCTLYGIEMDEKCSVLYLWLNRTKDKWDACDEEETAFRDFGPGVLEECSRQVDEWYEEEQRKKREAAQFKKFWNVDKFVGFCLRHWGYPEDYVDRCMENNMGLRVQFSRAYAVMKSAYPSGEFTFEDVQLYTHLYSALAALVDVSDRCGMDMDCLLGVDGLCLDEDEEPLFKPENLPFPKHFPQKTKESVPGALVAEKRVQKANLAPVGIGEAGEEDYLTEIALLRKKLNDKEQENRHLREMYRAAKTAKGETEELLKKYEGNRRELIALREFAYKSTAGVDLFPGLSVGGMESAIRDLKLVIIGGHVNWVKKLKKQFPGWMFVPLEAYKAVDEKMLEGKDRVYFFTGHLNHAAYGKFIACVRDKKIPFGYLGSVNVDAMVRLIYEEMFQE